MTETLVSDTQPNIYLERSGKGSLELATHLLEPSLDPLDTIEVAEVQSYEAEICDFLVDDELTLERLIKEHKGETFDAPAFFAEAFIQGHVHIEGLEGQLRQFRTSHDVYSWLAQAAHDGNIPATDLREMARQSASYYKIEASQAILLDQRPHPAILENMPIVLEPEKTLRFARGVMTARDYLLKLRTKYGREASGIEGAKRALTDIYTKRINGQIAGDIPVLEFLIQQSQLIDDTETVIDAYQAIPASLQEATTDPVSRLSLNKRLDYIRNGIGYDEDGKATAVDMSVLNTIETSSSEAAEPLFTREQEEALRQTEVSPVDMQTLFTNIIETAGLLSSEDSSTWTPGRGRRAADELLQVVKHPTKDTFAVSGIDGVIMIPNKARSLYEVLTVGIHELTHINQVQADQVFGKQFRIGNLKGRRVSMLRETGANLVQRQAERELFGRSKPVALTYARAIQSLENGGDMFEATKAFYDEKQQLFPDQAHAKLAAEAADRVLRLMLGGGVNSQPMSYAEENIMNHELASASPEIRQRATLLTNLDLDDQERLHRYGLLPPVEGNDIDWMSNMMSTAQPLVHRALHLK